MEAADTPVDMNDDHSSTSVGYVVQVADADRAVSELKDAIVDWQTDECLDLATASFGQAGIEIFGSILNALSLEVQGSISRGAALLMIIMIDGLLLSDIGCIGNSGTWNYVPLGLLDHFPGVRPMFGDVLNGIDDETGGRLLIVPLEAAEILAIDVHEIDASAESFLMVQSCATVDLLGVNPDLLT